MQFFISPDAGRPYASPRHQFVRQTVLYLPIGDVHLQHLRARD